MVDKITTPITPLEQVAKINEVIDALPGGGGNYADQDLSNITSSGETVIKNVFDEKLTLVNSLPASPSSGVWYAIPE